MSSNEQTAFNELIAGVLKKYDSFKNKQDIQSFVLEQLAESGGYSEQEQKEVFKEISSTIDMLDESFASLHDFKGKRWFTSYLAKK